MKGKHLLDVSGLMVTADQEKLWWSENFLGEQVCNNLQGTITSYHNEITNKWMFNLLGYASMDETIASWIHSYFDNVMTKFIVRIDACFISYIYFPLAVKTTLWLATQAGRMKLSFSLSALSGLQAVSREKIVFYMLGVRSRLPGVAEWEHGSRQN